MRDNEREGIFFTSLTGGEDRAHMRRSGVQKKRIGDENERSRRGRLYYRGGRWRRSGWKFKIHKQERPSMLVKKERGGVIKGSKEAFDRGEERVRGRTTGSVRKDF